LFYTVVFHKCNIKLVPKLLEGYIWMKWHFHVTWIQLSYSVPQNVLLSCCIPSMDSMHSVVTPQDDLYALPDTRINSKTSLSFTVAPIPINAQSSSTSSQCVQLNTNSSSRRNLFPKSCEFKCFCWRTQAHQLAKFFLKL
jgi:hypothetical protein